MWRPAVWVDNMVRPAKRKRALLESNPLRNNRWELIALAGRESEGFPVRPFLSSTQ